MTELYLAIAVLCFIVAIMVYCVNKTIQHLGYLYSAWKDYKQSQEKMLDYLRRNE